MHYITHPYPGELIYSTFGRYQRNMNIGSFRVNEILLSIPHRVTNYKSKFSVMNLNRASECFGEGYTGDFMVENYTIYRYIVAFLPNSYKDRIKKTYLNGGRTYQIFYNKKLRICPICVKKDKEIYGEPYFHTIHQLDGILVCPECNIPLIYYESDDYF